MKTTTNFLSSYSSPAHLSVRQTAVSVDENVCVSSKHTVHDTKNRCSFLVVSLISGTCRLLAGRFSQGCRGMSCPPSHAKKRQHRLVRQSQRPIKTLQCSLVRSRIPGSEKAPGQFQMRTSDTGCRPLQPGAGQCVRHADKDRLRGLNFLAPM